MSDDPKLRPSEAEDEHPLASPTELAGGTEAAIAAEFAARDALERGEKEEAAERLPSGGE